MKQLCSSIGNLKPTKNEHLTIVGSYNIDVGNIEVMEVLTLVLVVIKANSKAELKEETIETAIPKTVTQEPEIILPPYSPKGDFDCDARDIGDARENCDARDNYDAHVNCDARVNCNARNNSDARDNCVAHVNEDEDLENSLEVDSDEDTETFDFQRDYYSINLKINNNGFNVNANMQSGQELGTDDDSSFEITLPARTRNESLVLVYLDDDINNGFIVDGDEICIAVSLIDSKNVNYESYSMHQ
ncbi:hypothetical protein HELRODRAFT_175781 [Helobdella robusta]|uniref:Uncharacterized protein n=1 Tax=Helobdella robusta TaxID=6412 RepID=T1F9N3_HELRO|nr:hypothetical protein HELRODRAFT_175781 [Helobdella robusta]ESO00371.1 hypothetical protein HELRODRAFT_175781 [Helobdella robusta]